MISKTAQVERGAPGFEVSVHRKSRTHYTGFTDQIDPAEMFDR